MNRNEWIKRNSQGSSISASRKKEIECDFKPDQKFIDNAISNFIKSGGKIKIPVESA